MSHAAAHLFRHDEGDFHVPEVRLELRPYGACHGNGGLLWLFRPYGRGHGHLRRLHLSVLRNAAARVVTEDVPAEKRTDRTYKVVSCK